MRLSMRAVVALSCIFFDLMATSHNCTNNVQLNIQHYHRFGQILIIIKHIHINGGTCTAYVVYMLHYVYSNNAFVKSRICADRRAQTQMHDGAAPVTIKQKLRANNNNKKLKVMYEYILHFI